MADKMSIVHSFNMFHAVGHGTFFTGEISLSGTGINSNHERFTWAFDCGSKRAGRIPAFVDDLVTKHEINSLDMLCISHFDADHVNGLKHLLARVKVDTLVLPYLPLSARLELASSLDEDQTGSVDAMLACLDISGFLALRKLSRQVGRIVLIRGTNHAQRDEQEAFNTNRHFNQDNDNRDQMPKLGITTKQLSRSSFRAEHRLISVKRRLSLRQIRIADDTDAANLRNGLWSFEFFNKTLPEGLTPKTKVSLTEVGDEIRSILEKYDLTVSPESIVEGWRSELRQCYDKHFGADSRGRNDISLCVLSYPLIKGPAVACGIFSGRHSSLGVADEDLALPTDNKLGVLLTGDLTFDSATCTAMQNHFRYGKWDEIGVMQIPHHGSRKSWEAGIEKCCSHTNSILCVPDHDPAGHHPDANLVLDLMGHNPVRANYSNAIQFKFHIDYP